MLWLSTKSKWAFVMANNLSVAVTRLERKARLRCSLFSVYVFKQSSPHSQPTCPVHVICIHKSSLHAHGLCARKKEHGFSTYFRCSSHGTRFNTNSPSLPFPSPVRHFKCLLWNNFLLNGSWLCARVSTCEQTLLKWSLQCDDDNASLCASSNDARLFPQAPS